MLDNLSKTVKQQLLSTTKSWLYQVQEVDPIRRILYAEQLFCINCIEKILREEDVGGTYFMGVMRLFIEVLEKETDEELNKTGVEFIETLIKESLVLPLSPEEENEYDTLTLWEHLQLDEKEVLTGVVTGDPLKARIIKHIEIRQEYWRRLSEYFSIKSNLVIPTIDL